MEEKINLLEVQKSGRLMRLMTELNSKSRVKVHPRDTAVEMGGGDVVGLTMSPPTSPVQEESAKSAKLPGSNRPRFTTAATAQQPDFMPAGPDRPWPPTEV